MDFEFECQFAYITNDGEHQQQQQQQQTTAGPVDGSAARGVVDGGVGVGAGSASSNGNEAKRLKQE